MSEIMRKPPSGITPLLGVTPRHIWKETRCVSLAEAIYRYRGKGVNRDLLILWAEELVELLKEAEERSKLHIFNERK